MQQARHVSIFYMPLLYVVSNPMPCKATLQIFDLLGKDGMGYLLLTTQNHAILSDTNLLLALRACKYPMPSRREAIKSKICNPCLTNRRFVRQGNARHGLLCKSIDLLVLAYMPCLSLAYLLTTYTMPLQIFDLLPLRG